VNVLGVCVNATTLEQARDSVNERILQRRQGYICCAASHSVMACYRDPSLRRLFNRSAMTAPDGMPLVWLARLRGYRHVRRVYGPDLMLAICEGGQARGYRHFLYGGDRGVVDELASSLRTRFRDLQIVGTVSPPIGRPTQEEDAQAIAAINDARADIVWVGLSTPKQERWMAEHLGRIEAPILIGVGAAFDFLSGTKPQAPRWMQRSGLEWLFRLASEPRRLWPRYREYPLFLILVAAQMIGLRRFPAEDEPPG
jgi:N-acetylglucosaminyldiphosphoundecaprenol N-acetyl-beta-D-mannosaminyltransferase